MFAAIRHALFGFRREEQEEFLVQQIYRLSKWVEQITEVEHARRLEAAQPGAPANDLLAELTATLAVADRAKARVSGGLALSRVEFNSLRELIARLEQAMDVAPD